MPNGTVKSVAEWRGKMSSDMGHIKGAINGLQSSVEKLDVRLDEICANGVKESKRVSAIENKVTRHEWAVAIVISIVGTLYTLFGSYLNF